MGMDVYGVKATTEAGKYFRNNVWAWRPLAAYCCLIAPDITATCQHWQSNDGGGLNAADSLKLADALQAEVDSGRAAAFGAQKEAEENALPDEPCRYCDATGVRTDAVGVANGFPTWVIGNDRPVPTDHPRYGQTGWCNACDGKGFNRPTSNSYWFSVENVQEFIAFLRDCGGFEIH